MASKQIYFYFIFLFFLCGTTVFPKEKEPSSNEIKSELNSAIQLMRTGFYDKSLIKCRHILQYAITHKDNDLIASTYNTIGGNFDSFSNLEKSFFYYSKGLIYAEKSNNLKLQNLLHNNLGNIYCFDKKEYIKGIYHYKKSLEYSTKVKDTSQLVLTNLNIAWAYFDINEFNNGYPYLQFVNAHHQKHGRKLIEVALNMLNAIYYVHTNEKTTAEKYFKKAIAIGATSTEKFDLALTHQEYAKFLETTGKYKKAYDHLNLYQTITTELDNNNKLNTAKNEGFNLEIEEYKREIDKIESEFNAQQKLLEQEKMMSRRRLIASLIIFMIGIVLFYFYNQNTKIIQKNKLNELRNKVQQNLINATISGQELERKKIASVLHDNISALLSAAGLHLNVYTTKNQQSSEEITKTISLLNEAHNKVRDLSHELIPGILVRFGLFYALEDLCEKNSNSSIQFQLETPVSNQKRYPEELELKIYNIASELINNIIKHSEASIAKISIEENQNYLKIQFIDNGKGFDIHSFEFIKGFGLTQIKARINSMKGDFILDSKKDMGTLVTLIIPILAD